MARSNILFTSAGRRVELIHLFVAALEKLGLDGTVVTADLRRSVPLPGDIPAAACAL